MAITTGVIAAGGGGVKNPGKVTGAIDITTKKVAVVTPRKSNKKN